MKKLLLPALLLPLLAGCGNHGVLAPGVAAGALSAQSKAGVDKGIHAMFRAAFVAADVNHDGKLSLDETPLNLPVAPVPGTGVVNPADPVAQGLQRQSLFLNLDLNKDGFVTFREFARTDAQQAAIVFYRSELAKIFTAFDKNGDHVLTSNELEGSDYKFAALDLNANGKITSSEFEDAILKLMGSGPDPVPAPAPAPAGGDTPAPAPAPAGDTPVPAPVEQPAAH